MTQLQKQDTSAQPTRTPGSAPPAEETREDKGLDQFPISDLQFDVCTVIYEKSKALQAYDKYLRDCQAKPELLAIFEQIAADDRRHVEDLKQFLGNC